MGLGKSKPEPPTRIVPLSYSWLSDGRGLMIDVIKEYSNNIDTVYLKKRDGNKELTKYKKAIKNIKKYIRMNPKFDCRKYDAISYFGKCKNIRCRLRNIVLSREYHGHSHTTYRYHTTITAVWNSQGGKPIYFRDQGHDSYC